MVASRLPPALTARFFREQVGDQAGVVSEQGHSRAGTPMRRTAPASQLILPVRDDARRGHAARSTVLRCRNQAVAELQVGGGRRRYAECAEASRMELARNGPQRADSPVMHLPRSGVDPHVPQTRAELVGYFAWGYLSRRELNECLEVPEAHRRTQPRNRRHGSRAA